MTAPPSQPPKGDRSRQLMLLKLTVSVLLGVAFLILVIPGPIPKPIRIVIAMTDLIAAAAIWLMGKQRLSN
ncbi:MAG: hypothetical protein HOH58_04360 [Opitutaceae bacterium]|jgi:hypothetical protein|nr:hypothetical protein [Opitutaceae bacterium]